VSVTSSAIDLAHLLCTTYVMACVNEVLAPVQRNDGLSQVGIAWLVGFRESDECELLEVRLTSDRSPSDWSRLWDDLSIRGAARVRFTIGGRAFFRGQDLPPCFPGSVALPSIALQLESSALRVAPGHRAQVNDSLRAIVDSKSSHDAWRALHLFESSPLGQRYPDVVAAWRLTLEQGRPMFDAAPLLRRVVHSGDGLSVDMNRSLGRAIARRRPFTSADDAVHFVRAALERRLRAIGGSDRGAVTARSRTRRALATTMSASL